MRIHVLHPVRSSCVVRAPASLIVKIAAILMNAVPANAKVVEMPDASARNGVPAARIQIVADILGFVLLRRRTVANLVDIRVACV